MRRHIPSLIGWVVVGLLIVANPGWTIDAVLQEAQRKLLSLGYDPGIPDGVYGPRTNQAIEAFQRAQKVPVTGILDTETLRALDRETAPAEEDQPRIIPDETLVLEVVLTYLRFYAFQPARLLPYLSESFRDGLSSQEWVEHTVQTLVEQDYLYLEWMVQRVEVTGAQATVAVYTRVRSKQQAHRQQEVFGLQKTPEGAWLIHTWRVTVLPPVETTFKPDS